MARSVKLVADPYPPYQYREGSRIVGVDHDLIRSAFGVHDLKIEVSLYPWDICLELMESGRADGLFQIQPTPEREEQFAFSTPLRTARTVFIQNAGNIVALSRYETLSQILENHTLGLVTDYSYSPEIDEADHSNKVEVSSQEALLRGVSGNDFDLALMDLGVAEYVASKLKITNVEPSPGFEIERHLHVAFRKDREDMVRLFDAGLGEVERQGLRKAINRRYHLNQ